MTTTSAPQRVLHLLGSFRFVPTHIIASQCFSGSTPQSQEVLTSRALRSLRHAGLVESQALFGQRRVHYLTEAGANAIDVEGGRGVGPKLGEFDHDLAVLRLWLALRADRRVTDIITERDARSAGPDPADNPWAIPIVRAGGKEGWAWPDLITLGTAGQWGHEVEWTTKNEQRLRRLMLAYGHSSNYAGGVYYYTHTTQHVVETCAAAANDRLASGGWPRCIVTRPLDAIIKDY